MYKRRFMIGLVILTVSLLVEIDAVVVAPPNQILLAGGELILVCTSDTGNYDDFTWSRIDPGGSQIMSLRGCFLPTAIPPPYFFVGSNGSCELHVTAITTAEAGQYQCLFAGAPVSSDSLALVVLEVPPSLDVDNYTALIFHNITLEFEVQYAGGMIPEAVCTSSPSGIIEFDLPSSNISGGILFSKFITSYTEGYYSISCDVKFRPTGLVITNTAEPLYVSGISVTVRFIKDPVPWVPCGDCLVWIILLIIVCVLLVVIIVLIILCLLEVIAWRVEGGCGACAGIAGSLLAIIVALAGIIVAILIATGVITSIVCCKELIVPFTIVLSLTIAGLFIFVLQLCDYFRRDRH